MLNACRLPPVCEKVTIMWIQRHNASVPGAIVFCFAWQALSKLFLRYTYRCALDLIHHNHHPSMLAEQELQQNYRYCLQHSLSNTAVNGRLENG